MLPCSPSVQPAPQLSFHKARRARRARRLVPCGAHAPAGASPPPAQALLREVAAAQAVSPPHVYAQRSLAAARRLWAPPPAVEEERGMAGGERGGRLRRMRRSRVWQALAARLWRRVGLDARSLRPLCRAFALDSLQQLQARAAPHGRAPTRARRAPAGPARCTATAANVRGRPVCGLS